MERILQVIGGMNRRGAETFIMNVYRKIDKTKYQFDFLVYEEDKQDYEDEINAMGGRVLHVSCAPGFKAVFSVSKIKDVIRTYGPYKAIHVQTLLNSAWALFAASSFPEIKRITHSHSTHNVVNPSLSQRLYEKFALSIIRKRTQVMAACGEEAGEYLFGEKFKKGGIVLNNGIDVDIHTLRDDKAVEAIRTQYGLKGKLVIGSVARFNEVKNHPFMVQIAKAMKAMDVSFRMMFVGNGSGEENIRKMVHYSGLDDEIIFTGLRSDIRDLMFTFDVFLMPSHFEGNPVTLIEAQAAGLPCVMTDVITDKMDMGLGLITKCSLHDSPSVWAETIVKASKERCIDVARIRERFRICEYDAQTTADKLTSIFEK